MKIKRFNELNENISFSEIINHFLKEVTGESNIEDFTKATYEQIHNLHRNANGSGIYYNDEYLLFTSENVLQNWQYYAGYEYIDEKPDMIKIDGSFLAIYSYELDDRISDDLYQLNEK
jgi:hypothetical protein